MRHLPSAKVYFLGRCPRSGRNQNLHRRDSEAEDRRAAGRSLSVGFQSRNTFLAVFDICWHQIDGIAINRGLTACTNRGSIFPHAFPALGFQ